MRYPQPTNPNGSGSGMPPAALSRTMVEAITVTSEVCGVVLSPAAAEMLAKDLAEIEERQVLAALSRCRLVLQGALRLPENLARIEDGRPGMEEAWAMMPKSELASVVWTDEMAQAWGVASPMLAQGDLVGARQAFCQSYAMGGGGARGRRGPGRGRPAGGGGGASRERGRREALE